MIFPDKPLFVPIRSAAYLLTTHLDSLNVVLLPQPYLPPPPPPLQKQVLRRPITTSADNHKSALNIKKKVRFEAALLIVYFCTCLARTEV